MRSFVALTFSLLVACSGPTKKPEGAIVDTGSDTSDNCCCKSNPLTSEDGKPLLENINRIECGTKQGECVDEVQCANSPKAEPTPPAPEPSTDESAPAVEP